MKTIRLSLRNDISSINKIEAIKCIRWLLGLGLKEAKYIVDELDLQRGTRTHTCEVDDAINIDTLHSIRMRSDGNPTDMYHQFNIEFLENVNTNTTSGQVETVEDMEQVMKGIITKLIDLDAPEVLQSGVIFYNTIKKHLKNRTENH